MRFKKQKRHRRAVKFYMACFGFRQPFKVLMDGTFIHHLVENRIGISPPKDAVSSLLGGSVMLFTTRCILAELRSLGESHLGSLRLAGDLKVARCDHEKEKSAVDCILEIIEENNPEHFFVATIDADLRKKLQEISGVPTMFGLRNALFLDQPSEFQRKVVKSAEEGRVHMTEMELKVLGKRVNKKMAIEGTRDSSFAEEDLGDQNLASDAARNTKKVLGVKDRAQFKRKKAKGKNPLSCLKKQSRGQPQQIVLGKEGNTGTASMMMLEDGAGEGFEGVGNLGDDVRDGVATSTMTFDGDDDDDDVAMAIDDDNGGRS